jgi:hypothetical protein
VPDPFTTESARRTAGLFYSLWTLRRDVKRNNDLVLRQYEDLVRWARDDAKREAEELEALIEDLNKQNLFYSGHRVKRERELHEKYAQRWRDRKSEVKRAIRDVKYSENVLHWIWRRISFARWPTNPFEEEIDTLSEPWETILAERG